MLEKILKGRLDKVTINPDLANAIGIITFPTLNQRTKPQIIQEMMNHYEALEKRSYLLSPQETLFFLTLIVNLTLYFHTQKKQDAIADHRLAACWSQLRDYYQTISMYEDSLLSPRQKGRWAALIANVYQETDYYVAAIRHYQKALDYENMIQNDNDKELKENYRLEMIVTYLKAGYRFKCQNDFVSATTYYQTALQEIKNSLPNSIALKTKLLYLKSQVLVALADLCQEPLQLKLNFLRRALKADYEGLKITTNEINEQKFIRHIQSCCQKLLPLLEETSETSSVTFKHISQLQTTLQSFSKKSSKEMRAILLEKLESLYQLRPSFWQPIQATAVAKQPQEEPSNFVDKNLLPNPYSTN